MNRDITPVSSPGAGAPGNSRSLFDRVGLKAWRTTAWVAAVFCLLLASAMYIGHTRVRAQDPWKSPRLAQLKEHLLDNPKDEQTKVAIRELDLKLRQRYFQYMSRMENGVYLLLGGVAVFLVAASQARMQKRRLPDFGVKREVSEQEKHAAAARWSVAGMGAGIGAVLFLVSLGFTSGLPRSTGELDKLFAAANGSSGAASIGPDFAPFEEFTNNWPRFLGPFGNSYSPVTNAPLKWDVETGEGIAWKVPSPVAGYNSPIVWGDRIYFSGGDADKREVVCLDAKTGQTLWREALTGVPNSPAEMPEIPEMTGFAAPTMATDGKRVYVIFANADVGAFTMDGKKVWGKYVGPLDNAYGHANSLAVWDGRLILQLDQGYSEDKKSKLVVLEGSTGKVIWEKAREFGASWSSPMVFASGGKAQVMLLSLPYAVSYSLEDGAELWRAECLNGEITPSPIFAGGLVLVPSPSEKLVAIRPDGTGDVTKTHIAWENEDSIPDVTSPTSDGDLVFMLTTSGFLTCVDVKDGKRAWEHDYELEFHASPAIAGDHLYVFGQHGEAFVSKVAREYQELFHVVMPDSFHASPAIVDGRIYLRGMTNIWCLKGTQ